LSECATVHGVSRTSVLLVIGIVAKSK